MQWVCLNIGEKIVKKPGLKILKLFFVLQGMEMCGSRGSVIPLFVSQILKNERLLLLINMTRFLMVLMNQ